MYDYKSMLELVLLLARSYITHLGVAKSQEDTCLVIDIVLEIILAALSLLHFIEKTATEGSLFTYFQK